MPTTDYARAKVLEIVSEDPKLDFGFDEAQQVINLEFLTGPRDGSVTTIEYTISASAFESQKLKKGNRVIIATVHDSTFSQDYILDKYRLPWAVVLTTAFGILAVALGRRKGFGALVGLAISLGVITLLVVPWIIRGGSPLLASVSGALVISVVSMLLAHGTAKRTQLALGATLGTLALAVILSLLSVALVGLTGGGSEEAIYLQIGYLSGIDLRGLLLGGIIIGALGVLDDVTTAQVAAIEEIHKANPALSRSELYRRGLSVGQEHIASLVNTLMLAYVGASFPLFLLFSMPDHPPLWIVLNGENILEEVLRGLVGGASLMLAVPISTALAAISFGRKE